MLQRHAFEKQGRMHFLAYEFPNGGELNHLVSPFHNLETEEALVAQGFWHSGKHPQGVFYRFLVREGKREGLHEGIADFFESENIQGFYRKIIEGERELTLGDAWLEWRFPGSKAIMCRARSPPEIARLEYVMSEHIGGMVRTGSDVQKGTERSKWERTHVLKKGEMLITAPDIPYTIRNVERPFNAEGVPRKALYATLMPKE